MGVRYAWIDTHMYEQSPFRCAPPPPAPFSSLNERTEFSSSKSSSSKSSIDLLNRRYARRPRATGTETEATRARVLFSWQRDGLHQAAPEMVRRAVALLHHPEGVSQVPHHALDHDRRLGAAALRLPRHGAPRA
eukprot:7358709-Pyramimonas_sp.AAC.1